jgi:sortase A
MLGYCGLLLADGWRFQRAERAQFESVLMARSTGTKAAPLPAPAAGGLIGRIEIPRLELSVMVVEGADNRNLRHAAGHIRGTGLPGRPGNVGISAHRDTYFRPLRNIRRDDVITLTTVAAAYRYRVVSTKVVRPNAVAVLDSGDAEVLTLVTCYPFYFVGPAPDRFIVRAVRM